MRGEVTSRPAAGARMGLSFPPIARKRYATVAIKTESRKPHVGEAVYELISYMPDASGFDIPFAELRDLQVRALNERLQERIDKIKLVKLRADEAGITEIRSLADIVPLLLPHTAYKSYPESFLTERKWDRLTKWLGTVSTYPTDDVDLSGGGEVDALVEACGQSRLVGSFASGTRGK